MEQEKIKERIREKTKERMNRLFRRTLAVVEQQAKDFGVRDGFFDKDNRKGFGLARKTILDNGNEVLEYIDGILAMLNIEPVKATMEIPEKVIKEMKDDSDASHSGGRSPRPERVSGHGQKPKKAGDKPGIHDTEGSKAGGK